jgi:hypothetical protein
MSPFVAGFWLCLSLLPLVLLERWIHRHLQGVWLLVFRHDEIATIVYSLIMLPGVLLHESSHWLAATLLFVRTGRFSVIPERLPDGTLRLGYIETERPDLIREALIGAAPLLTGCLVIIFAGYARLGVGPVGDALARSDFAGVAAGLAAMTRVNDFWLWLYLTFTVSNSMLPSAADRRAWLPVLLMAAALVGLLVYLGLGPTLVEALGGVTEAAVRALAAAFTITVCLDMGFVPIIWAAEMVLMKLTGLRLEY